MQENSEKIRLGIEKILSGIPDYLTPEQAVSGHSRPEVLL